MAVAGVVAAVDADELGGVDEEVDDAVDGLEVAVAAGVRPALEPACRELASCDERLENNHAAPATTTAASTATGASQALEPVRAAGGEGVACVTGGGGAARVTGGGEAATVAAGAPEKTTVGA